MSIKPTFPPKTTPANFSVNLLVTLHIVEKSTNLSHNPDLLKLHPIHQT